MTPRKVVELPFNVIVAILERAGLPAEATDAVRGGDSPISRPRQLLPSGIITALKKARSGVLIGDRQMVALQPDEATVLTDWLRWLAAQPGIVDADGARFRDAADAVERAQ